MKRRDLVSLILFIVYLGAVLLCCFGQFDDINHVERNYFGIPTDKIVHFIMFLPFPFLCFRLFASRTGKGGKAVLAIILVFIVGCILAAGTEIGQSFTTYRTGDPMDYLADVTALAIASIVTVAIHLNYKKTS